MGSGAPVEHGGRVELRLECVEEERVSYRLELASPEGVFAGAADVALESGQVLVRAEPEPPEWLASVTRALLHTLWRDRRRPDAAQWPRRITRWRRRPR